eukprot:m.181408 g.181408  ORF g.181408 m.181408 type:complete len:83 (-) comp18037_c1_seq3:154-402(-)
MTFAGVACDVCLLLQLVCSSCIGRRFLVTCVCVCVGGPCRAATPVHFVLLLCPLGGHPPLNDASAKRSFSSFAAQLQPDDQE